MEILQRNHGVVGSSVWGVNRATTRSPHD